MKKSERSHKSLRNLKSESSHKLLRNLKFENCHKLLRNLKFENCHKLLRNLKSQMIGQVFIYVLAVVLIGVILIYGYNAITTFMEKQQELSLVKFKNDLSNIVEIVSTDYGSVKIKNVEMPSGYSKVCFVKNYPDFPTLSEDRHPITRNYPIIKDSVNNKIKKNVFLVKGISKDSFFIGDISVENDIICVESANNVIKIRFEGKGDHSLLAEAKT